MGKVFLNITESPAIYKTLAIFIKFETGKIKCWQNMNVEKEGPFQVTSSASDWATG